MPRWVPVLLLALAAAGPARAAGLLVPTDADTPPLAMVNHHVSVAVEDQVAVTRVEQVFRNHTDRALEATYVFPVPRGASVNKFTLWVDGKETRGELVEAEKARTIYTDIVRRTQDPGLLEYMGNNLLRVRVFPVPAHGDQKLSISFTSVAARAGGLVEYVYPLKTDGRAAQTLEQFTLRATLKSRHKLQNIYSPSHPITVHHKSDTEAVVEFERDRASLDRDFQLFYALGNKDVGLTALMHRPSSGEDGYFMLLVSPRAELSRTQQVPRDMVFVLDTSGSMSGPKMEQARKALKFCLGNLGPRDRFALINFATAVNRYEDKLLDASPGQIARAKKWVDELEANGGTAINDALASALELRTDDRDRTFTVVFFTDGLPTVGENDPEKILKNTTAKNTSNTRIFTFGVGDDVNAVLLDRLAEQTRAVSTYVRPEEDIEVKVSGLYAKISHPVLTNLKLAAGGDVHLSETYPRQLPDLFHGGQVVVLGRYRGRGHVALTLTGTAGKEGREFVYEVTFPGRTKKDREFVEGLWARRKVGYLLDQVRGNGEKKELVDEVVKLAKKYGITTPYTSYLVVPDAPTPPVAAVPISAPPTLGAPAQPSNGYVNPVPQYVAPNMTWGAPAAANTSGPNIGAGPPGAINYAPIFAAAAPQPPDSKRGRTDYTPEPAAAAPRFEMVQRGGPESKRARVPAAAPPPPLAQTGKDGVDLAVQLGELRNQARVSRSAARRVLGRTLRDAGGVWFDEDCTASAAVVKVKPQGKAYFRILELHPEVREVFQLGNRVVWVTPSGTALVIEAGGSDELSDAAIEKLFVARE